MKTKRGQSREGRGTWWWGWWWWQYDDDDLIPRGPHIEHDVADEVVVEGKSCLIIMTIKTVMIVPMMMMMTRYDLIVMLPGGGGGRESGQGIGWFETSRPERWQSDYYVEDDGDDDNSMLMVGDSGWWLWAAPAYPLWVSPWNIWGTSCCLPPENSISPGSS